MQIKVRGKNPKISNQELRYCIRFMSSLLMSKRLTDNLHITLKQQEYIKENKTQYLADVVWTDTNYKPREFKIRLATHLSKKKQLLSLAHELVHVKQMATGEMTDCFRGGAIIKWKKEPFSEHEVDYYDYPWEIEAYGRELGLYVRYKEHLYKEKIKWS